MRTPTIASGVEAAAVIDKINAGLDHRLSNDSLSSGRDRGFDPLIQHLAKRGISCRRIDSLEMLSGNPELTYSQDFLSDIAIAKLAAAIPKSRPKKRATLYTYLKSVLTKYQPSEPEIKQLLDTWFATGKVTETKDKISYKL